MKSLIIFVLLIALLAAAFFTRPSQGDFQRYVTQEKTAGQTNLIKEGWAQFQADQYVRGCTFNDRLLWIDVQRSGRTIYTGAFGHWFSRAQVANDVNTAKQKIDNIQLSGK